ncbi:MAG TPA: hypothetical protein VK569_02340 [Bacteroidota bacterium]|nr:hypothetical protein [Bacteroidota bacterium]
MLHAAAAPPARAQADSALPKFGEFSVAEEFKGKPAPVDLSSDPQAGRYRTRLREGAKSGPNFAGHYTIVIWGCGSSCQQFAIVDASTGGVYFSKEVPYVSFGDRTEEPFGLQFKRNSNLLAVYGHIREDDPKGIFFYTWDGKRLMFITSIPGE